MSGGKGERVDYFARKLADDGLACSRLGVYRIVYAVIDNQLIAYLNRVGHRSRAHQ
jgi:mRNA-degrading endonuclease RelE of RelBE toxin-antitoxin system